MNNKIGIITHYDVHNHGAVLQLHALCKVFENLGYNAKALRFKKDLRYYAPYKQSKYNLSIKSIPVYIEYLFHKGLKRTIYNILKRKKLEGFKKSSGIVGGSYGEACDIIVVGSDEVFSTEVGISKEFFNADSPYERAISYAASFGKTTMSEIERKQEKDEIYPGLCSFEKISVRDKNSYDILSQWGLDSTIVCDPVILYGFQEEIAYTSNKIKKPYLLIYAYDDNMNGDEVEKIAKYAKSKGLKTVSAGFYHKWCDININCDPLQLLGYFSNADCVVTDTFHGSVLSLITNRQFVVKVRNNSQKLEWLLQEYNLSSRISQGLENLEQMFEENIDYDFVNGVIAQNRAKSLQWLTEAVNE